MGPGFIKHGGGIGQLMPIKNAFQFESSMKAQTDKQLKVVEDAVTSTALDLLASVRSYTPVLTGRLKGNWQLTVGAPAPGSRTDWSTREPEAEAAALLEAFELGQEIFVSNNVIYARPVEFGGPRNVPRAMLEKAVNDISQREGVERS